jgi:hypothetical protein
VECSRQPFWVCSNKSLFEILVTSPRLAGFFPKKFSYPGNPVSTGHPKIWDGQSWDFHWRSGGPMALPMNRSGSEKSGQKNAKAAELEYFRPHFSDLNSDDVPPV